MPMKEKILAPPESWEIATALLETGAGSGLSFDSSPACRRPTKRKKKNAGSSFLNAAFIGEMIAAKVAWRRRWGDLWGRPSREPALSEAKGSKPSKGRQLSRC